MLLFGCKCIAYTSIFSSNQIIIITLPLAAVTNRFLSEKYYTKITFIICLNCDFVIFLQRYDFNVISEICNYANQSQIVRHMFVNIFRPFFESVDRLYLAQGLSKSTI